MDRGLEAARAVSRDAIFRVTLLSASIVGFSATLLSIEQIDLQADRTLLAVSWCLFAAVVVVGPMSVALEARAKYIVEWRSIQPQDFDSSKRRLTMTERIKLLGVLAYSVSIRPRSLFFARDTDYSRDKPTQGMRMNFFSSSLMLVGRTPARAFSRNGGTTQRTGTSLGRCQPSSSGSDGTVLRDGYGIWSPD
jgi:hypothetical protein